MMTEFTNSGLYAYRVLFDRLAEPVGVEFRRYNGKPRVVLFDADKTCLDWASMSRDVFFTKYERRDAIERAQDSLAVIVDFLTGRSKCETAATLLRHEMTRFDLEMEVAR